MIVWVLYQSTIAIQQYKNSVAYKNKHLFFSHVLWVRTAMFCISGNLVNSALHITHSSAEVICLARVSLLLVARSCGSQVNDCSGLPYINVMHL